MTKRTWGTIYARGNKLWLGFVDETGARRMKPLGLDVGQEAKAEKVRETLRRRIAAAKAAGVSASSGPLTVARYLKIWSDGRRERNLSNAGNDERRLEIYAMPLLGNLEVAKTRTADIKRLVVSLRSKMGPGKDDISPRTVLHVYGLLRTMFQNAAEDELIEHNPCVLTRKYLPKKTDKVPGWRQRAVYSRSEVEMLISDERIPEQRRVLYAVLFLTGMRINEASARRWRDLDPTTKPLGMLLVATSWDRKKQREKPVKTEVPREVPVHPTLAKVLAAWKVGGWERYVGRPPREDDLIIPDVDAGLRHRVGEQNQQTKLTDAQVASVRERRKAGESARSIARALKVSHVHVLRIVRGARRMERAPVQNLPDYIDNQVVLRQLHSDLVAFGMRARSVHNFRRTFISLARADGASRELLRPVTHGRTGDQMDDYTTVPWDTVCGEVAKLRVSVLAGKLLPLPLAASAGALQSPLQSEIAESESAVLDGRKGTRTLTRGGIRVLPAESGGDSQRGRPRAPGARGGGEGNDCSAVAEALSILRELLEDHRKTEPHHEDVCGLCIRAEAALRGAP